jgi:O-antigen/teichoic acid export membrane protein
MWREWRCIRPGLLDLRLVRDLLAYGLPLAVTFALNFIVHSSDRILLGWLISYEAAGTYAAGYDLTQMSLTLLMMVVNLAAYPQIVRSLETEGQSPRATGFAKAASCCWLSPCRPRRALLCARRILRAWR